MQLIYSVESVDSDGEDPINRVGPKKLSRTVAELVYGRSAVARGNKQHDQNRDADEGENYHVVITDKTLQRCLSVSFENRAR